MKAFAVTGELHGIIAFADNKEEAIEMFSSRFPEERILIVKDISDYNLENL